MKKQIITISLLATLCAQTMQGMNYFSTITGYIPTTKTLKNGLNTAASKVGNNWEIALAITGVAAIAGAKVYYYYKNQPSQQVKIAFGQIKSILLSKAASQLSSSKSADVLIEDILSMPENKDLRFEILAYGKEYIQTKTTDIGDEKLQGYINDLYRKYENERYEKSVIEQKVNVIKNICFGYINYWRSDEYKMTKIQEILGGSPTEITKDNITGCRILLHNNQELLSWANQIEEEYRKKESSNNCATESNAYKSACALRKFIRSYYVDQNNKETQYLTEYKKTNDYRIIEDLKQYKKTKNK